ncbi:MAG: hypothetical protein MJ171_00500, partial [Clostridia bacterium]|nr:hypothetical protein [Clostridia bacterium]
SLDSGEATTSYRHFIMGEVRYNSLTLKFPERAERLFTISEEEAKAKYENLKIKKEGYDK